MRFWDASALAPLAIAEQATELVRSWLAADPAVIIWAWTPVEVGSAIERKVREGHLSRAQRRAGLEIFEKLWENCDEVTDLLAVRARALPLLSRHPLRAADAAQLAAALLIAAQGLPGLTFVSLDSRLAEAAEREGLRVLTSG